MPVDANGSFYHLLLNYGFPDGVAIHEFTNDEDEFEKTLTVKPLYMARTGGVVYNKTQSSAIRTTDRAVYSSNTIHSAISVLVTYFDKTALKPTNGSPKTEGEAVRCLAR